MTDTRHRHGQKSSLIDLVFSNREELINEINTEAGLGKSDHSTLIVNIACNSQNEKTSVRYNYSKADYNGIIRDLQSIDWGSELTDKSTEETWTIICEVLDKVTKTNVPILKLSQRHSKKWMDRKTLEAVRLKHRHFRKWKKERNDHNYSLYLRSRNQSRTACRNAQIDLEKKIAKQSKTNPKVFWSYVKSKTSTRSGIGDLRKSDGTKTTSDQEKADMLNSFFKSVFTVEDRNTLPEPPVYPYNSELSDFEITPEKVHNLLSGLQEGKSSGPDGINPKILSRAASELSQPISHLFITSLKEEKIPDQWRQAKITPIFKKGSRLSVDNYRPVSLTCVTCKVMEKLIRDEIMSHLESNNLITDKQHGFVHGRSCTTQLLEVMDTWTKILDEGGSIDAVYMDFKKAFDSVPHQRLLSKIEALGVKGHVLGWIRDFLKDRKQSVKVGEAESFSADVTSGIPQGSVLGPILFIMYINDLPNCVQSHVNLFADDTKIFTRSDNLDNRQTLQDDLDRLEEWSDKWLLRFHPEKCSVMKIGKKKSPASYTMKRRDAVTGTPSHITLKESNEEKDLGVYIDESLSFKVHVAKASSKANQVVGVIRRSFDHLTPDIFLQLYKALVRPILEYGHTIWQPFYITLVRELENVQRRATKTVPSLKDKPYEERLIALQLPTLEHRRARGDLIDLYKYINGVYNTSAPNFRPSTGRTRGNCLKLPKEHFRLQIRKNFFSNRVVNSWNSLPNQVVCSPSVNAFKANLDRFWANQSSVHKATCYQ